MAFNTNQHALRVALSLLSILLLFASLLLVYAWAVGMAPGQVYNSDQFHGFMLAWDILRDPSAVLDWYHSPAIYVVPDWLLAAIPFILQVPDRLVPIFHGGLLMGSISIAGGWLLATTGRTTLISATWAIACLLALFAVLAFANSGAWISRPAFLSLGAPVIHTGAILMTLLSAALLMNQLNGRGGRMQAFLLGVVVFVSAFSDFTYLVWFMGPAAVLGTLHWWTARDGNGLRLVWLVVGTAVAGVVIERIIRNGGGVDGYQSLSGPLVAISTLGRNFRDAWMSGDYALLVMTLATLALLVRSAVLLVRSIRRPLTSSERVELFLGGSSAASVLAPVMIGVYSDPSHWRYFLIAFFLPLVWAALWLMIAAERRSSWVGALAAAITILISAIVANGAVSASEAAMQPSALETCIETEGRTTGISEYWPTKLLMLNSSGRIHLVQVDRGGEPYRWNYNRRWFTERTDGTAAEPDFIIMENLDPEVITKRYGVPARTVPCGHTEIWLYDQPLDPFKPIAS